MSGKLIGDSVRIRHREQYNLDNASFYMTGLRFPKIGGANIVVIVDGQARSLDLELGAAFHVREQTWRLDSVKQDGEYEAILSRVV